MSALLGVAGLLAGYAIADAAEKRWPGRGAIGTTVFFGIATGIAFLAYLAGGES